MKAPPPGACAPGPDGAVTGVDRGRGALDKGSVKALEARANLLTQPTR